LHPPGSSTNNITLTLPPVRRFQSSDRNQARNLAMTR